jgi:hypothetical protein
VTEIPTDGTPRTGRGSAMADKEKETAQSEDDTEGHKKMGLKPEGTEDTEGHIKKRLDDGDEDDTEGHKKLG